MSADEKGRWESFDVYALDRSLFWTEPRVSWEEPVYPDEMDDYETPSPADEAESGSEFLPSGSTSE